MATKKEQYELAITQSYLIEILQFNDFSDENMEKSRMMLKKLQENYSFREDDFYHPRISREEEIKSALKKVQMAGQRENVNYYLMLKDEPKYTLEQQNAADLLCGIHFNEDAELTKRQFYLMAKYVSVANELNEMAVGRIEGGDTLDNYMEEANKIVDELNTSGTKDFYQEHDFEAERAQHADVLEEMIAMGGRYHYYRSNSWYEPDEEDYDEEKYEMAQQFLTLDWELSNTFADNITHILEKAPMLTDAYYAEKIVDAIEILDDNNFFTPVPIDKTLAKTIWDNYRNDAIPQKERQAYFSMIVESDKMSELLEPISTNYPISSSDREKINETVKNTMRFVRDSKFEVTDDNVSLSWKDKSETKKVELEYDGTMEGLRKACVKFNREEFPSKNKFVKRLEMDLNRAIKELNHLPSLLYSMQHMATEYVKTGGEQIAPSIAEDMKILSQLDFDDVLNGRDTTKYWKNITTNTFKRMVDSVKYNLIKYGDMYKDDLYKHPVATKRVLKAYQVLNGIQPRNIIAEHLQRKSKTMKI